MAKEKESVDTIMGEVFAMTIDKRISVVNTGLKTLTEADLESVKNSLNTRMKDMSPGIAYHQFYDGKLLTETAYDLIKDNVPEDQVKKVTIHVPIMNKERTAVESWKEEDRYVNKKVIDLGAKHDAGALDENTGLQFRYADSVNTAELNSLKAQKGIVTAHKSAIKSELAGREAVRAREEMEKKNIKLASLKELVAKMYPAQKIVVTA